MNSRVTAARVAALERQLTERDRAVIEMLRGVRLANGQQLRRAIWASSDDAVQRAAQRQLARLVKWQVLERFERRTGGLGRGSEAYTYALAAAGQRIANETLGRRPRLPGRTMWLHTLQGTETYVRLIEATRGTHRCVKEWQGEPACWIEVRIGLGEVLLVKPDAFVVVSGPGYDDLAYLETDTGSQSRSVVKAKLVAYERLALTGRVQRQHGSTFPAVVFVTVSAGRQRVLDDVIATMSPGARELFKTATLDDAARVVMGGEL